MSVISKQYICINIDCETHKDKILYPRQRECPDCGDSLVEKKKELVLTEDEKEIINKYPSVIALPFYELLSDNEDSAFDKITRLKDTYEISLRYLALLVISEYYNSELRNRDFNSWINKFYQDTSVGTVETFLELSIPLLHKLNHSFFIIELLKFHKLVFPSIENNHKVKIYKIIRLENIVSETIKENIFEDSLLKCLRDEFRNNYFGHGFKWPTEVCLNILHSFKPLLIDFLKIIDFTKNYTLTNKHNEECFELIGFKLPKQVTCNYDFPNDSVWVTNNNSKKPFELAPFFIQLSADKNTSKILHYFFDYPSKTRIRYRNLHSEVTVTDKTLQAIEKLKKKKEVKVKLYNRENISRKILSNTANNYSKNVIKELNDEGIYIKCVNQPREDILLSLKEWLGAKFGLFFISSIAGSGKTNLMVNLRSEYIGYFNRIYKKKRNDILLLRSGKTLHNSFDVLLREILNLESKFDFNCFNSKLGFTQADPFIILVDAGNEHEQPLKFLNSILNFIKKYKGGYIKIVLTWRADIKNELPKIPKSYAPFIYSKEVHTKQEHILAQKAFVLKPFNHKELAKAWDDYMNTKDNLFNPKFSFEDLNYFDKNLVQELKNPLNLRLFLDFFNGKELPKTKGFFNFWENWSLQFKDSSGEFELLMALVEVMFEYETDTLPFDSYYEHPKLIEYIKDDANGPFERLKTKKVITQFHLDGSRYLSITLESFYHYMLGEFLYYVYKLKPNSELLELLKTSELKGVKEGIQFLLIKDVNNKNLDRLNWLIDNSNEELLDIYAIPLYNAFKSNDSSNVFFKLFHIESQNDWKILNILDDLLENFQEYIVKEELYSYVLNREDSDAKNNLLLRIKASSLLDAEKKEKYIDAIYNSISKIDIKLLEVQLYKNIADKFLQIERFNDCVSICLKLLELFENDLALDIVVEIHQLIGESYYCQGDFDASEKWFLKGLKVSETEINDKLLLQKSEMLNSLGCTYLHTNRFLLGKEFLEKAIEISTKTLGELHEKTLSYKANLADVLSQLNELKKAEKLILQTLSVSNKLLNNNHPNFSQIYYSIENIYTRMEKFEKALIYARRGLDFNLKWRGRRSNFVVLSFLRIGNVYLNKEDYELALKNYKNAIELSENGSGHHFTALNNIGELYLKKDDFPNALKYFNRALENNRNDLFAQWGVARVYFHQEHFDKALKMFLKLEERIRNKPNHQNILSRIYYKIATIFYNQSNVEKSIKFLEGHLVIYKSFGDSNPKYVNKSVRGLHTMYLEINDFENALKYALIDFEYQKALKDNQELITDSYASLGSIYFNLKDYKKATEFWELWWKHIDERKGGPAYKIYTCYKKLNEPNEAIYWLEQTALLRQELLGEEDERTINTIKELLEYAKELNNKEILKKWSKTI